jgi:hypothetical protein
MAGGGNGERLPGWFYLVRAGVSLLVGAFLVIHEAFGTTPPGPVIFLIGLVLMGFAPADLATFIRAGGK